MVCYVMHTSLPPTMSSIKQHKLDSTHCSSTERDWKEPQILQGHNGNGIAVRRYLYPRIQVAIVALVHDSIDHLVYITE